MTKELVTIEFRYRDKPKGEYDSGHPSKTITIGVFDTLEEAIVEGNKALEVFEKHFKIHVFPKGNEANKDRFGKSNGCFGSATRLVTPLAYLQTPFDFYAKITKLTYGEVEQTITEVLEANKRYKEHKLLEQEE
jgi:hypothetical protein